MLDRSSHAHALASDAYNAQPTARPTIPAIVRRNTFLLSTSQTLYTIVAQVNVFLGAFMIIGLTGDIALAGLGTAIAWGGRLLIVYHSGKLMDRLGRVKVLQIGTILSISGAAIIVAGLQLTTLSGTVAGLLVYGFGVGATQQNRVAVADMFPARRRGEGIGYLLSASVAGALIATPFIFSGEILATFLGYDRLSLRYASVLWLGAALILIPAIILNQLVKPDPKNISERLREYYPEEGHSPLENANTYTTDSQLRIFTFPVLATFAVSGLAQGNMTMNMALVPLVLEHHGAVPVLISAAITVHILGMYGLSTILGRWADIFGRPAILTLGASISGVGALITPLSTDLSTITFGIFLVGLGWSAATVASTAQLSDLSKAGERGRVIGLNDLVLGAAALTFPFLGGVVLGASRNFYALAVFGLAASFPAILMTIFLHGRDRAVIDNTATSATGER